MNYVTVLLALLVILLIISLVVLSLFWVRKNSEIQKEQIALLSKLSSLVAAKGPLEFQAIQAMDSASVSEQLTGITDKQEIDQVKLAEEQYFSEGVNDLDRIEREILGPIGY